MTFETFKSVIEQYIQAGGGGIDLTPIVGDALIDKGLTAKIAYARSFTQIKNIHLFTNAILLSNQLFDELVDAGLTSMVVSMSGFDPKEYERVYRSREYNKVLSNLQAVADSNRFKKCKIEISLRTDSLFPYFNPEYRRLSSLGFQINRLMFFDNWSGRIKKEQMKRFMFLRPKPQLKKMPCEVLYGGHRGPMVLADGNITACGCRDMDGSSELSLGNITETTLAESWNNEKMKNIRRRFIGGEIPNICRDCTFYSAVRLNRLYAKKQRKD